MSAPSPAPALPLPGSAPADPKGSGGASRLIVACDAEEVDPPVRAYRGCSLDAAIWNAIGGRGAGHNGPQGPELRLLFGLGAASAESWISDQDLGNERPRCGEDKARRPGRSRGLPHGGSVGLCHRRTRSSRRAQTFLSEKPSATGLAVPGMPIGSPGMEGGTPEPYEVVLFGPAGRRSYIRFVGENARA